MVGKQEYTPRAQHGEALAVRGVIVYILNVLKSMQNYMDLHVLAKTLFFLIVEIGSGGGGFIFSAFWWSFFLSIFRLFV